MTKSTGTGAPSVSAVTLAPPRSISALLVARAPGLSEAVVRDAVVNLIMPRQLDLLGEPTVNVLSLNLTLDQIKPNKK